MGDIITQKNTLEMIKDLQVDFMFFIWTSFFFYVYNLGMDDDLILGLFNSFQDLD